MPRKTDAEYETYLDEMIDRAMSRLNVHKGNLICRSRYNGKIADDIELVLAELHRHRQAVAK